ncbi:hypothetical protein TH63_04810 [Rufibacter radiotolerans]|uniref:Glycosyltransferase 2-like domain-containing protein n=1 Tax=Rufibacter radiotolerans TaxID=1379910 RepID=A0A0H4VNK4_9BACT|nr:hypothetical protein TH63_04810 [Rufibacter radiotolerans]
MDVCVLIPCFNNQEGLTRSLQSISYQATGLFVMVVDDGSTAPVTAALVKDSLPENYSFHLLSLPENRGITHALNAGLHWIQENLTVRYIARLDCGDVCHQDRFYQQVRFLYQHPLVGLLGSWCRFQSPENGLRFTYTTPTTHAAILDEMHARNVFIHPTVMFRASLVKKIGGYPTTYPFVEDYALFYQMLHHMQGAILNLLLVTCEINEGGISMGNRSGQLKGRYRVVADFGTSPWLKMKGLFKLSLLQVVPYNFVLWVKSRRHRSTETPD